MLASKEFTIDGAQFFMEVGSMTFDPPIAEIKLQRMHEDRRGWTRIEPEDDTPALAAARRGFELGVLTALKHYQDAPGWEPVELHGSERIGFRTHRLDVPGGWLYRVGDFQAHAVTFVPKPQHTEASA